MGTRRFAKARLTRQYTARLHDVLQDEAVYTFPKPVRPRATLIIPVFNQAHHTLRCLISALAQAGDWLEVMVYDDASTDETTALLGKFKNITIVRNAANQGFLRSVNDAVSKARGRLVAVMNNDACFKEGSLREALDWFESQRDCGMAGVRIAQPLGGLQEAGAMIFRDGTTNGYLRFHDVNDPRALFIREVDYCSGVFFITRRATFRKLGGFDEAFAPAYYEETDYCMRLRQNGLRCLYYPKLMVEHFEFGSSNAAKARSRIARNRSLFLKRWSTVLEQQGYAQKEEPATIEAAARRLQKQPSQLMVIDIADYTLQKARAVAPRDGSLTVFLTGCPPSMLKSIMAEADFRFEFVAIANVRGAKALLRGRRNTFERIELELSH